ncbi:hypothetical protein [Streptomyces sp. SID13031]|uniref:hypothetical protein n=1 Tax=Streptomyces sp. SID13031 TaxID=2706046 RepID=UPI0013CD126C|nr:hypothetical protein [Streptomyces sp. SID13031]NEA33386.1 hypothetical protein [Streptomyces sp. SID13031]
MSYPSPPGPQNPPPQGGQNPTPGWQSQPYQSQSQPYQPQGGNWAAPPYGGPPRRNRAGLIIVLIAVLLVAVLAIAGFLAFTLTAGNDDGGTAPAAPPPTTGKVTQPVPSKTVPSAAPSKIPTKPVASKPVTSRPLPGTERAALNLAVSFIARLNAGDTDGAVALTCADTKSTMPILVNLWIAAPTKLAASEPVIGQDPYLVPFTGTTKGSKVSGTIITQGPCVRIFQLKTS